MLATKPTKRRCRYLYLVLGNNCYSWGSNRIVPGEKIDDALFDLWNSGCTSPLYLLLAPKDRSDDKIMDDFYAFSGNKLPGDLARLTACVDFLEKQRNYRLIAQYDT